MWEDLKKSEKSTTYSADYTVGGLKFDALTPKALSTILEAATSERLSILDYVDTISS